MLRAAALAAVLAAPAAADCRLALVLAMDVSRSVNATDFAIQTEGLAIALEDPAVRAAFFLYDGQVALSAFQWSGEAHQDLLLDWTLISSEIELDAAIGAIRGARRPDVPRLTALGAALRFGAVLMAEAPPCRRRVLDMAGDGRSNEGISPARVYEGAGWEGITVNALAIGEHEMGLLPYLRHEIIRGPGAFVEVAPQHKDFPRAIRRKLLRELTEAVAHAPGTGTPAVRLARRD
jgi:Protein of unknown function (DUF1194)